MKFLSQKHNWIKKTSVLFAFAFVALLLYNCSEQDADILGSDTEQPLASSNLKDGEKELISVSDPLSVEIFKALEERSSQVARAEKAGLDFGRLMLDYIIHTNVKGSDVVYIPFSGEFGGYQITLVAFFPDDGSSLKLLLQEATAEDLVEIKGEHREFYSLDYSVNLFDTKNRGKNLRLTSRNDEEDFWHLGGQLDEVVVYGNYSSGSTPTIVYTYYSPTTGGYTDYVVNSGGTSGGTGGGGSTSSGSGSGTTPSGIRYTFQILDQICGTYKFNNIGGRFQANMSSFDIEMKIAYASGNIDLDLARIPRFYVTIPSTWTNGSLLESRFKNVMNNTLNALTSLQILQRNEGVITMNTDMTNWYQHHFPTVLKAQLKLYFGLDQSGNASVQYLYGPNVVSNRITWCPR